MGLSRFVDNLFVCGIWIRGEFLQFDIMPVHPGGELRLHKANQVARRKKQIRT